MVGRTQHGLGAVTGSEVGEAVLGALARGDHRLDVTTVVRRRAGVLQDVLKQRLLPDALVGQLDRAVDVAFRPVIDEVDGKAGEGAADVEQMRRGTGEADQLAVVEDGHDDRDVGRVGRTEVRIVVQDDVARVDVVAQQRDHALDDLRHGAHEHRRGVRLGDVVALRVKQARAEVLGLADDRRVRHAVEHTRHLLGDGVERAADHAHQDRLREAGVAALRAPRLDASRDVDHEVAVRVDIDDEARGHDRRRVVLLDDRRAFDAVTRLEVLALVERRRAGLRVAIDVEDDRASLDERSGEIAGAGFGLGPLQLVNPTDADDADVDDLDRRVEAMAVLALVGDVEGLD